MKYSIRLKGQVVQTIESKTPQNQAKITDGWKNNVIIIYINNTWIIQRYSV